MRIHCVTEPIRGASGSYQLDPCVLDTLAYDVLVVPGDLGAPVEDAIPLLASLNVDVVLTLGNKDMRSPRLGRPGYSMSNRVETAQQLSQGTKVHVLERGEASIGGVTFIGAHLGFGCHDFHPYIANALLTHYNDLDGPLYDDLFEDKRIFDRALYFATVRGFGDTPFTPDMAKLESRQFRLALIAAAFERDKRWLVHRISELSGTPLVVVTHTPPDDSAIKQEVGDSILTFYSTPPSRNEAAARYALNSNGPRSFLGSVEAWTVGAWVYGQGSLSAMHLSPSGVPLVSCGGHVIDRHYAPGAEVFDPLELRYSLSVRKIEALQDCARQAIAAVNGLVAADEALRQAKSPKTRLAAGLVELAYQRLTTVAAQLTSAYTDIPGLSPAAQELLQPFFRLSYPRGKRLSLKNYLGKLDRFARSAPMKLLFDEKYLQSEYRKACKFALEALAARGLTGELAPQSPMLRYLRRRWPIHIRVAPQSSSGLSTATDGERLFQLELELERDYGDQPPSLKKASPFRLEPAFSFILTD